MADAAQMYGDMKREREQLQAKEKALQEKYDDLQAILEAIGHRSGQSDGTDTNPAAQAETQDMLRRLLLLRKMEREGTPFRFKATGTPLSDMQTAYRFLPESILSKEQRDCLDQAVAEGSIAPLVDVFGTVANSDDYRENGLVQALGSRATENQNNPLQYLSDDLDQQSKNFGKWYLVNSYFQKLKL